MQHTTAGPYALCHTILPKFLITYTPSTIASFRSLHSIRTRECCYSRTSLICIKKTQGRNVLPRKMQYLVRNVLRGIFIVHNWECANREIVWTKNVSAGFYCLYHSCTFAFSEQNWWLDEISCYEAQIFSLNQLNTLYLCPQVLYLHIFIILSRWAGFECKKGANLTFTCSDTVGKWSRHKLAFRKQGKRFRGVGKIGHSEDFVVQKLCK